MGDVLKQFRGLSEVFENVPKNLPADFLADFQTLQRDLEIALIHPPYILINAKCTYQNLVIEYLQNN